MFFLQDEYFHYYHDHPEFAKKFKPKYSGNFFGLFYSLYWVILKLHVVSFFPNLQEKIPNWKSQNKKKMNKKF